MGNEMSVSDLGEQLETSYTFMIDNFSHRKASIRSPTFLSGQCEWYVEVYPQKNKYDNSVWLCLAVENPYSSSIYYGWKRRANFRFIILNQFGKVVYKTIDTSTLFSGHKPAEGVGILPLSMLKGMGGLENDKLIVKVEVKVVEVAYLTGREMSEVETFEVPLTQVQTVSKISKSTRTLQ
ncbi:PREDICTED: MATH domain and coiled-coil domain-containing protein At2g42475-like [Camelina sativa]|uniref:MATH domain and coiled-coil domain-containing protein At2g42475-like n=1 Tax=Camelina sativa TaxID=90675 RepID=A0ABM0Z053_CAMSA|nr:PREDICTED: MATH domain and coiled-coil domain-containing protein At2g42475-like [Camelina sativa]